jgi:hypothetical protein
MQHKEMFRKKNREVQVLPKLLVVVEEFAGG